MEPFLLEIWLENKSPVGTGAVKTIPLRRLISFSFRLFGHQFARMLFSDCFMCMEFRFFAVRAVTLDKNDRVSFKTNNRRR